MKKRILSVFLTLSLVLGLFTGCGNGTQSGNDADGSGTENAMEQASENEAGAENVTALSLMQEVNNGELAVIDDKYRTYYEVFLYSFYDSDGDGIGDINGLIEKLDYINDGDDTTDTDLGCNGIWLMPIMPSTTYHKYDITDYYDIDPQYGTLDDFDKLIEECHSRGINVIIDFVMNHTSSQHEWFTSACDYLKGLDEGAEPDPSVCPYVDYYNFSRTKGSSCYQVAGTDWYYEAPFWSEMPDLNLGNEAVRAEIDAITTFWLDRGVDGFRLDAAKEYYSGTVDANVEVLTWFNDMVKAKKEDAYIVAEVWNTMDTYAKYYASGIDSCFDFAFADSTGVIVKSIKHTSGADASSYGKALVSLQEMLAQYSDSYIDAPFYTNHDLARSAGYYSGENSESQVKIAQAMNLLMSGCAFLYYGEELGMKGSGKDENKRAPMYWSADASAEGMCDGPQYMENVKMKYPSFEEQETDGNSIYNFVKETIRIRNTYPEIARGTVTFEEAYSDADNCVIRKTYDGEEVLLVFHLSENAGSVDLSGISVGGNDAPEMAGVLLTGTEAAELSGTTLELPAYSVVILK